MSPGAPHSRQRGYNFASREGRGGSSTLQIEGAPALRQVDEVVWEIPVDARHDMRVPARVFADRELLEAIATDRSLEQLQNVATLPGIVGAALAMPDVHQGYGFPVGGRGGRPRASSSAGCRRRWSALSERRAMALGGA